MILVILENDKNILRLCKKYLLYFCRRTNLPGLTIYVILVLYCILLLSDRRFAKFFKFKRSNSLLIRENIKDAPFNKCGGKTNQEQRKVICLQTLQRSPTLATAIHWISTIWLLFPFEETPIGYSIFNYPGC